MVQHETDPLTGAARDAVFMSRVDAEAIGAADGAPVTLRSESGTFRGRVFCAPIRPGNLEVHWPEGSVLLGSALDPESREPDYNTRVTVDILEK
jgi:anaerobic selenocysteine-containing dehydrogenase